jgi:hypothetical protein
MARKEADYVAHKGTREPPMGVGSSDATTLKLYSHNLDTSRYVDNLYNIN